MPREYVGKVYAYKYVSYKKKKKANNEKKAPAKRKSNNKKKSLMNKLKGSYKMGTTKLFGLRSGKTKLFR